jgi:hypothetical protein
MPAEGDLAGELRHHRADAQLHRHRDGFDDVAGAADAVVDDGEAVEQFLSLRLARAERFLGAGVFQGAGLAVHRGRHDAGAADLGEVAHQLGVAGQRGHAAIGLEQDGARLAAPGALARDVGERRAAPVEGGGLGEVHPGAGAPGREDALALGVEAGVVPAFGGDGRRGRPRVDGGAHAGWPSAAALARRRSAMSASRSRICASGAVPGG